MRETLIDQINNEKIVYPVNARDQGWNDAVSYIVGHYGNQIDTAQALLSEWLDEGRFLVANTPEMDDLVERTKEATND